MRRSTFNALLAFAVLGAPVLAHAEDAMPAESPYDHVMSSERASVGSEQTYEYIASGAAAVVLGIYGYYNTSPNPVIKLLYAATQTAGVLTIGQAIRNRNSPSLMLDIDDAIRGTPDEQNIRVDELRKRMVTFKQKSNAADARTLAYTSSILSMLYFYNGYRETGTDPTLRNVYFFLGFNFAVGGGVGFYRTYKLGQTGDGVAISVFPVPTITYEF